MRGYAIGLTIASLASMASASVAFDWSAYYGQDTALVVRPGSGPSNGIVSYGTYQAVYGEGTNGGVGILGEDATGVRAIGEYQYPAITAEGRGYYSAQGIYGTAVSTYNGVGVTGEVTTGTYPVGVIGRGITYSNSDSSWGVKGYSEAPGTYSYGIGVGGEAVGGNTASFVKGVYGYAHSAGSTNWGVYAEAQAAPYSGDAIGIYAIGSSYYNNTAGVFDGDIIVNGTCYCTPSDEKLKKNVQPLDLGLNAVMAMQPKKYDMKVDEFKGRLNLAKGPQMGLIAQEVEKIVPEAVTEVKIPERDNHDKDGKVTKVAAIEYKTLNYVALIPVLIKAIQEQEAKIEALEKKLAAK